MKKIFTQKKLNVWLILLFALLTQLVVGQALYTGGEGGGYDAISIGEGTHVPLDSIYEGNIIVTIFPNPIRMGQNLYVRYRGNEIGSPLQIAFSDILGNTLYQTETIAQNRFELSIPSELLRTGVYLVSFSTTNQKITLRLSLIN